jgi:hypothetical protein
MPRKDFQDQEKSLTEGQIWCKAFFPFWLHGRGGEGDLPINYWYSKSSQLKLLGFGCIANQLGVGV